MRKKYLAVVFASCVTMLALYLIGLGNVVLATGLSRLAGAVVFALLAFLLARDGKSRTVKIPNLKTCEERRALAMLGAVAVLVTALLTMLLAHAAQPQMLFAGWILTFAFDVALIPLTVQILRDNRVGSPLPWPLYLLIAFPAVCLALLFFANGPAWSSCLLFPAALSLSLVPIAMWHAMLDTITTGNDDRLSSSGGFQAVHAFLCLLSLAMGLAVLFNLNALPLSTSNSLMTSYFASMCVLAGTAVIVLRLATYSPPPGAAEQKTGTVQDARPVEAAPLQETPPLPENPSPQPEEPEALTPEEKYRIGCAKLAEEYNLTSRQKMIIELIARGLSRSDIAEELVLSRNTVNSHARSAYNKLKVHSRDELLDLIDMAVLQ